MHQKSIVQKTQASESILPCWHLCEIATPEGVHEVNDALLPVRPRCSEQAAHGITITQASHHSI